MFPFFANKNLGQHFLRDKNIIKKIVRHIPKETEGILEIGPGKGALTEELAKEGFPLHVVEKDQRLIPLLQEFLSAESLHIDDALEMDIKSFCEQHFPDRKVCLVSNLPYNIGVPLLIKFMVCPQIFSMILMFQKEVGHRILASSLKNEMNSLGGLVQNYFSCSIVTKVSPGAFLPPPKVDSLGILFFRFPRPFIALDEFDDYESFLRKIFSQKRKQIGGILKKLDFVQNRVVLEEILQKINISPQSRAESFNLRQIQLLYTHLKGSDVGN